MGLIARRTGRPWSFLFVGCQRAVFQWDGRGVSDSRACARVREVTKHLVYVSIFFEYSSSIQEIEHWCGFLGGDCLRWGFALLQSVCHGCNTLGDRA